jgi:hypothetical protein
VGLVAVNRGERRDPKGRDAFLPVFSPDGGKIAFEDVRDLRFIDIRRDIGTSDEAP